jgi:hypothetical protein
VAHGVNPAVKRVEPARLDPSRDRPPANPRGDQLSSADDAMLAFRKGRNHRIRPKVENFGTYTVLNFSTLAHAPNRDAKNATELALSMPKFKHHSPNTLITNRLSRPPSNSA